jgi:RNA polymerase sigma-70 factor (ECF subfamily)
VSGENEKVIALRPDLRGREHEALLIRKAAGGDMQAMEKLLEPFEGPLLRYCNRMLGFGRRGDAADVAQEVFVRIMEKIDRVDASLPFKPFFYRIATNVIIDHQRQEGRRGRFFSPNEPADAAGVPREPGEMLDLQRALGDLPLHYQSVLVLRVGEGLDYEEISATLQIPLNTVKTYLHRARRALKKRMEREP